MAAGADKRGVDPRRTRKALRAVRKLAQTKPPTEDYSGWEQEFLAEVETRLTTYGSAFADLSKGAPDEALSRLQAQKLKEIEAKAKGKKKAGLAKPLAKPKARVAKAPPRRPARDINDD